ncbi:MAG: 1,4-dihydroxy-2-naphthoate polyprenyltransferase [Gorillibacterium sp.]|nr:1,4-dihydroxy-2-naphthoate polyprenyltransferase [Gorillibacterium sp.]
MTFKVFLKLVEFPTKVASMIPLALGTIYAVFRFDRFVPLNFFLMFVSLLAFDMTTTAINNYIDYIKAVKTSGYGYESHNAIAKYHLSEKAVLAVILTLLSTASVAGILLVLHSDILVLFLGGLSFLIGILYTFGPVPISRMPLGEIISGLFMGYVIVFVAVFIHTGEAQVVWLDLHQLTSGILTLRMNLVEIIYILIISVPAIMGIANIMLANNICDMDEDLENKRYTLPLYIGKKNALLLFRVMYYVGYVDLIVLLLLGIHPLLLAIILITLWPLNKNIKHFDEKQLKAETFILSVKNFAMTTVARIIVFAVAFILGM